ncbi:MAG: beta-ketoacyl synthase [Azospira oryzae]|jgi:3-oxoacyl-[acyl-carrier-protein] synthase-1|nr:MAG: beta-ketoacyl synthase [Azospira oryzae]
MRATWVISDNIISALGATTEENYRAVREGKSGITPIQYQGMSEKWPLGKITDSEIADERHSALTRFEKLAVQSAEQAIRKTSVDPKSDRTIFILSSTKGNIELLEQGYGDDKRIHLHEAAKAIARFFGNTNTPVVVSSACISGVMAMLTAKYLLENHHYEHAVVIGADVLSYFVISGFQSLQAMSAETCKPFDKKRNGVNLGEAASTILLSSEPIDSLKIRITGGGLSNDANHISGPSRTGEELNAAIQQALREAGIRKEEVDFISAHGTATRYNDEMEAKAFSLAGMENIPLNSLKGYVGHTLGAAGVLESIISIHALQNNELLPSLGYEESGLDQPLNVITKSEQKEMSICLKTASGFGGCNAAIIFKKEL